MDWQLLGTVLGTVVGGQSVFELVKWFKTRKAEGRIAEAHADSEEFTTLSQTNLFIQQQLKDKEERFAEQTNLVRKLNTEVIQLTKEKAAVELEFERYKSRAELELERVRCNDRPCPWRQPPNLLTQPIPEGMEKDEYHKQKNSNGNN